MASKALPSPEVLRQLLRYEAETGKLFWRERDICWFAAGAKSADWAKRKWNTRYAGQEAFTAIRNTGYFHGRVFDTAYQAHRVAWAVHYGEWPGGEVDHINGVRTDNRIENLRDIPKRENQRNMKRNALNKSGVMGVLRISPTRWLVTIQEQYIGRFACFGQALKTRKAEEVRRGFHANHGRAA
jgi:hypothetical protein